MTSHAIALVIFARVPEPGAVKSRLGELFTPAESSELHAAMVEDVAARACEAASSLASVSLAWSHPPGAAAGAAELPAEMPVEVQPRGDLGERMAMTIQEKLRSGARSALILGSDAPTLPADHIVSALGALGKTDVVLGPARDGGYYLIGMSHLHLGLFRNMRWGTPEVLAVTRQRIKHAGLRCVETGEWWDVDRPEDVSRLWKELLRLKARHPAQLPRKTYAVLSRLAPGRIPA